MARGGLWNATTLGGSFFFFFACPILQVIALIGVWPKVFQKCVCACVIDEDSIRTWQVGVNFGTKKQGQLQAMAVRRKGNNRMRLITLMGYCNALFQKGVAGSALHEHERSIIGVAILQRETMARAKKEGIPYFCL